MTSRSLKATTAILAVFSLMQPLPALTQSTPGANVGKSSVAKGHGNRIERASNRPFRKTCADAEIVDARTCELHILALQAEAVAEAQAAADAAKLAAAEAEAAAKAAAEAGDAEKAAAETRATEMAQAAADAAEKAGKAADAAARIASKARAAARATAKAEARAAADAAARPAEDEAEAAAQAANKDDVRPAAEPGEDTATETPARSRRALAAKDCPAEIVGSDGAIRCVEALTPESIAALAAGTDVQAGTQVEVTTETVTESTRRASSEEFRKQDRDDRKDREGRSEPNTSAPALAEPDTGLSDLEKAGLLALGAVVVGAILSNGQRVETNSGDRVIVVDDDGSYRVLKDDDALLRQPGSQVRSERFVDGSIRTVVTRDDGTRIITIRDSSGRALRRVRIDPDGREYLLIDDTRTFEPVIVRDLPRPVDDDFDFRDATDRDSLRQALLASDRRDLGRSFSLRQVRDYVEVRELAPEINLKAITFATNSAALEPSQAKQLRRMGLLMRDLIADDPTELFLIEGHTDAVGDAGYNLLLSDRRAESVALAFSEYFGVPTENMVVQGFGESFLKLATQDAERRNRRVAVRRITALVR